MKNLIKEFIKRFKYTKLFRLIVFSILSFIFFALSQGYWNLFLILALIFAAYPLLIFVAMFIYAWILNPIREGFPNSWLTKQIKKLDKFR
jgi:hypothetical protein